MKMWRGTKLEMVFKIMELEGISKKYTYRKEKISRIESENTSIFKGQKEEVPENDEKYTSSKVKKQKQ